MRAREVARVRCERGALEVGLDASQGVAEPGLDRLGQRALGADEDTAGDEELGHVDVERRLRCAERRRRQIDEHRPVVAHEHVAEVEPAVGDACSMQVVDLPPQIDEHLVAHVIGARELQGSAVRLASDQECVAFGAERGDDDLGHPDAGLRGREERESLVLDLLEAPDRRASRRIAVGEEPPAPGEPLRVLRVAAEHPHLERTTLASRPTYSA